MKNLVPWGAAALAVAGLIGTNAGNISTLLGLAATKSIVEQEQERLEVFARRSLILYAGYDKIDNELGLVYFIESHPCVDYEITYSIGNSVIDSGSRSASVCEDLPELRTGTSNVRVLSVDPGMVRPSIYTVDGQLIQSDTATVLIQWKFKFSDGSFGYHTMTAAIPIEEK